MQIKIVCTTCIYSLLGTMRLPIINSDLLYIEVSFKAGMLYILSQDNLYRKQNWTISTCTRFRCQTRSRMAWSGLTPCTDIFGP